MAIYLIGKLKQKNNGKFALLDAEDVDMGDGTRLSDKKFISKASELTNDSEFQTAEDVKELLSELFVPITQEEYDALVEADADDKNKYYMIIKEEET